MENWIKISSTDVCPVGRGINALVDKEQVAVFHYGENEWYAVQNLCPHDNQMVMSRGLCGDHKGEPKVACPLHKNNFSLKSGCHLGESKDWKLKTYEVRIEDDSIFIKT
jgi:nitrite reductase (NADH) small subunit